MDPQKDTSNKENFLQNNQENKDINLFKKDTFFYFLFKKTEKLATAIHMVTNFFSADEPLRKSLREVSLRLLSKKVLLVQGEILQKDQLVRDVIPLFMEMISLLEISHYAGLVSSMNFSILEKELYNLVHFFESNEVNNKFDGTLLFASDFFNVSPDEKIKKTPNDGFPQDGRLGHSSGNESWFSKSQLVAEKTDVLYKGHSKGQGVVKVTREKETAPQGKAKRQELILGLFQKDKNRFFTIRDIADSVKGCSEKTLQRELIEMVAKGVLKKEGERRWSKYSFV